MLALAVYRGLGRLLRECSTIRTRVMAGAPPTEITLLVDVTRDTARSLQSRIGDDDEESFDRLHRHLYWIHRWHVRGDPSRCEGDVADLFERDLPAIIEAVERWEEGLLDAGLASAVARSWETGRYDHALRDAFVYLETALRRVGQIPPSDPATGNQLADRLLDPDKDTCLDLTSSDLYAPETDRAKKGVWQLFKGAFGYLRNPIAHRAIDFSPDVADEVLRVVNLLLRVIGGSEPEALTLAIPAAAATPELVERLRSILARYPGLRPVHLRLVHEDESRVLKLPDDYTITFTPELAQQLRDLLGPTALDPAT